MIATSRNEIGGRRASVSVVVTVHDEDPAYLAEAIESIRTQTVPVDETIVVEDGARRDYAALWARFPEIRVIRQANAGLAAARNTGLAAATGDTVLFLDGDDRLTPIAIAVNLASLAAVPDAIMAYGGYRFISADGTPSRLWMPAMLGPDAYASLLEDNLVEMHCTVLYDRRSLQALGGFNPDFRACEDYELYLRVARNGSIAYSPEILAEYRQHGANMSRDRSMMLRYLMRIYAAERPHAAQRDEWRAALARGIANGRRHYARQQLLDLRHALAGAPGLGAALRGSLRMAAHMPMAILGLIVRNLHWRLCGRRADRRPIREHHVDAFVTRHRMQHGQKMLVIEGPVPADAPHDLDCLVVRRGFDAQSDPAALARLLRPGGVALIAASPKDFTPATLRSRLAGPFDPATLDTGFYGNARTARGGLVKDFDPLQRSRLDAGHPVIITACARKAQS